MKFAKSIARMLACLAVLLYILYCGLYRYLQIEEWGRRAIVEIVNISFIWGLPLYYADKCLECRWERICFMAAYLILGMPILYVLLSR